MKEVIDLAADSQFSQFSKKVKQSLEDKLKNHPTVKATNAQKDSFAKMRDQFAQITKPDIESDIESDVEVSTDPVEPTELASTELDPVELEPVEPNTDEE